MIKLVIFDLDGTIADTIPDIANAIRKTIKRYGDYGDLREQTRRAIGNGARKMLERIYQWNGIPMDEFDDDLRFYTELYARENCIDTVLYPGTREMFEELKEKGIKLAVATMKPKGATNGVLNSLDVTRYMEIILSADDMEKAKPDPWSVNYICEKLGISPKETIMVGDSMTDVGSGINAGAVSVARLGGYYDQSIMEKCEADYFIHDITEIMDIVREKEDK